MPLLKLMSLLPFRRCHSPMRSRRCHSLQILELHCCEFTTQPQSPPGPPPRLTPDQAPPKSQIRADFRSFLVIFDRFRPILGKNGPNRLEIGSSKGGVLNMSGRVGEGVCGGKSGHNFIDFTAQNKRKNQSNKAEESTQMAAQSQHYRSSGCKQWLY